MQPDPPDDDDAPDAATRKALKRHGAHEAGRRPRGQLTADHNRKAARAVALASLSRLAYLLEADGELSVRDLVSIYRTACDRGGWLTGRDLAAAEVARWQVAAQLLATPGLSTAERKRILDDVRAREQEALAEHGHRGAGEPPNDLGSDE